LDFVTNDLDSLKPKPQKFVVTKDSVHIHQELSSKMLERGLLGMIMIARTILFIQCLSNFHCMAWSTPKYPCSSRRTFVKFTVATIASAPTAASIFLTSEPAFASVDESSGASLLPPVEVSVSGDAKKLFNEARALESQGNMAAAQRLYSKVTKIAPRFIYGWSNLGNTQTAFGDLDAAEVSYTTAIDLCKESLQNDEDAGFGQKRCSDLWILLLNRGSLRLNNGMAREALADLQQSSALRGRPDALVLQNLARAEEINGLYGQSDRDYSAAISMTANEVNPFWLRSAMVKLQLGDLQGGWDLVKRVQNRFPEAPEVRAAYAVFLAARGDQVAGQQKFLEIPDRQRTKYVDRDYLTKTISWPPTMIEILNKITVATGDRK
jgi:tetratricopeptide (TPR) repeat protein